jgi:hypothetical protein
MPPPTPTSQNQISLFGEAELTFSPAGFPASHLAPQDSERARMMTATSGRRCLERFEKLRQPSSWAKTLTAFLLGQMDWYSRPCALTWKMKVTKSQRIAFQLVARTPRTKGIDGGLLATPMAQDTIERKNPAYMRKMREGYTIDLNSTIAMLPTNRQRDWKGITQRGKHAPGDGIANTFAAMEANGMSTGLKLQPAFAFWMMGYPEDWTLRPFLLDPNTPPESGDGNPSKPPETPSSPKSPTPSSKPSKTP